MKRRILLVDDDVTVLLTLKAVLELNQFDVQTAGSAAEAGPFFFVALRESSGLRLLRPGRRTFTLTRTLARTLAGARLTGASCKDQS